MLHVPTIDLSDALRVFDHLPEGMIAHEITSRASMPILRFGEIAVADPADRDLVAGRLMLIQYRTQRSIVRTNLRKYLGADTVWMCDPVNLPGSVEELERRLERGGMLFASDGPYHDPEYLTSKLVGRVVGVLHLQPDVIRLPPPAPIDAAFTVAA